MVDEHLFNYLNFIDSKKNSLLRFILNDTELETSVPPGTTLLDFIRYRQQLTGTKIGCREGDCGACTVLVGEIKSGSLVYSSATSCLMALGNAQGKHIVTIEGLNGIGLNAIQEAFAAEGATQCGFCTPGFIVSMAGFCLSDHEPSYDKAIDAVNGNICRCTGYKSIERAAAVINRTMGSRNGADPVQFAIDQQLIPAYFSTIPEKLALFKDASLGQTNSESVPKHMGGGTDLYVQQHETIVEETLDFLFDKSHLNGIRQVGDYCEMGGAVTVTDIANSPVFGQYFPKLSKYIKLISSTQIRNMATVAGNFTNASPIGDLTIFFLALDATLVLDNGNGKREIQLRNFYKGYKILDKQPGEIIEAIRFKLPAVGDAFNFEKVCKRTHLDIASVNSALFIKTENRNIVSAGLSAGGVGPTPAYLSRCSEWLIGKSISSELVHALVEMAQAEISPISDARGTEDYKRFLLSQLIKAHFIELYPNLPVQKILHG